MTACSLCAWGHKLEAAKDCQAQSRLPLQLHTSDILTNPHTNCLRWLPNRRQQTWGHA